MSKEHSDEELEKKLFISKKPKSGVQIIQDGNGSTVTGLPEDHDLYFVLRSHAGEYLVGHKSEYDGFYDMKLHIGSEGELRDAEVHHAITDPGKLDLYYTFEGYEGSLTIWKHGCRVEYKLQIRDLEKIMTEKIDNNKIIS